MPEGKLKTNSRGNPEDANQKEVIFEGVNFMLIMNIYVPMAKATMAMMVLMTCLVYEPSVGEMNASLMAPFIMVMITNITQTNAYNISHPVMIFPTLFWKVIISDYNTVSIGNGGGVIIFKFW